MDKNENNNTTIEYLVPTNVSTKFEFVQGFGMKELFIVIIAGVFGVFVYLILDALFTSINFIGKFLAILIPVFITYFVVKRDPNSNMSLYTLISHSVNFSKKQNFYRYKYLEDNSKEQL